MAVQPIRRQFTVDEYYEMGRAGILTEDDRVELIEGEIVEMPPIGGPHASCVNRLMEFFVIGVGDAALVSIQNPLRLNDRSEPVPDVMLLRRRADYYKELPRPPDLLLLVEVCDTTLAYDEGVKVPLYALNGVPEVWLADLAGDAIRVHREPTPAGYRVTFSRGRGERIAPAAFSELEVAVDAILG